MVGQDIPLNQVKWFIPRPMGGFYVKFDYIFLKQARSVGLLCDVMIKPNNSDVFDTCKENFPHYCQETD